MEFSTLTTSTIKCHLYHFKVYLLLQPILGPPNISRKANNILTFSMIRIDSGN